MAIVRGSTLLDLVPIEGWELARSDAALPDALASAEWLPLEGPTTVAAGLRAHGKWSFDTPRAFDDETWWFRARIPALDRTKDQRHVLRIGGLATIADVFVDGRQVLHSENMFHEHVVDLDALFDAAGPRPDDAAGHELAFRFAALTQALAVKRPRPRWKTKLASHQQLRFVRTSLAGRMPGWSPPVPAVGPWRPVVLERWSKLRIDDLSLHASIEGGEGVVRVAVRASANAAVTNAVLHVGDHRASLDVASNAGLGMSGTLRVPSPERWWPHTHGRPDRYAAKLTFELDAKAHEVDLGFVGFRTVDVDRSNGGFAIRINGVPVFCRGASWTTTDIATLTATEAEYARVLGVVRDGGMNMLRLSGTLFYEADAFYERCDELGILIWQDLMFANMDYPDADEAFRTSVEREASEILRRLASRPCLTVVCGGSEVEQQASMFGAPREIWRSKLFEETLPALVTTICPNVPWVPSSPSGGALPFHVDEGVAHYYGVGAYLRDFDDARRSRVRFASECLAFANVPEESLFSSFLAEGQAPFVHARWKERTSKDNGSGWDFEDVRDHYVARLFGVDPMRLRYEDMNRYLALSRVATGEVMARVYAEFRRRDATARGALVWFLQDLWPGAGWGVLDSRGQPKSAYWFLKRSLQPLGLFVTDEGVNGLHLHVVNDHAEELAATLRFTLYRDGEVVTHRGETAVCVPARSAIEIAGDALLETFADTARAYRFGPPSHELAVASLVRSGSEDLLAETVFLLDFGAPPPCLGLEGALGRDGAGNLFATVRTKRFAHAVTIAVPHHVAADNYFDLAPGRERTIALCPTSPSTRAPAGELSALNLRSAVRITLPT